MYKSYIRNAKKRTARGEKNREIIAPDDGQQYAVVRDMLGNGRLQAMCEDGTNVVARIRGSMRKYKSKVIIAPRDLIILSMRDYEADKADVVHKYTHEETTDFMYRGYLPEKIMKALTENELGYAPDTDEYVIFTNASREAIAAQEAEREESDVDVDAI